MKLNKASFQYMIALLFSVATLFAQNITGTVSGDDGSALAGANVAVEGTETGASSNQDGSFSISGLSDGTYTVTASFIGYEDASAVVTVSGGQASSVNLTLDRGDIRLNQVVVSASLKKELVTEAPASVTVFAGEELQARNATTLTDVIGNQAGVEYMKTGLESSNLTLRGFNGVFSGAIHAVVDNRWTRAPVVNAQLLQFFAPDDSDIERVELVRGPASPMYGPDTQQGVISLFTKSPFNQGNRVALTVGDRNFMKVYGRVAHQWGARAATRVSFSHRSFDDWESNMPRTLAEAQAVDPKLGTDFVDSAETLKLIDANALDSGRGNALIDARVNSTFINNLTIDADTLGGQNSAYYRAYSNFSNLLSHHFNLNLM